MGSETKFLFETDFSDPEATEIAARVYSEEDLQNARAEALQTARGELQSLEAKRAADLIGEAAAKLDRLAAQRSEDLQSATEAAISIALSICQKVLPTLAAQHGLAEIEGHITRTLADVHGEPRVVVRVADENVDALQSRITELASGFDGAIVLIGDDGLAATDCHVMWADGGSERDVQRTWAAIDSVVAQITAGSNLSQAVQSEPDDTQISTSDSAEISRVSTDVEHPTQAMD